jgi:hypothetical protein
MIEKDRFTKVDDGVDDGDDEYVFCLCLFSFSLLCDA